MRKILLVGELSDELKKINEYLSDDFNVQLAVNSLDMVDGIIKITKPDMIIMYINKNELENYKILNYCATERFNIPITLIMNIDLDETYKNFIINNGYKIIKNPITKQSLLDTTKEILGNNNEDKVFQKNIGINKEKDDSDENTILNNDRKHILIVDDSALTLRSVRAFLVDEYKVSVATSGEMALKAVKKDKPDLILLDYEMPGFDGKHTLEMLRASEDTKNIPVIFLTGVADKEHIAAVLKLNPEGYFLKPPVRGKLLDAIEKILY